MPNRQQIGLAYLWQPLDMQRFPAASQIIEDLQNQDRFCITMRLLTLNTCKAWTLIALMKLLLLTSLAQLRGVKPYACKKSRNGRHP